MPKPLEFIRSVRLELNQVKWPTHQETVRLTALVVISTVIVALYSGGLDVLFTTLLQSILKR